VQVTIFTTTILSSQDRALLSSQDRACPVLSSVLSLRYPSSFTSYLGVRGGPVNSCKINFAKTANAKLDYFPTSEQNSKPNYSTQHNTMSHLTTTWWTALQIPTLEGSMMPPGKEAPKLQMRVGNVQADSLTPAKPVREKGLLMRVFSSLGEQDASFTMNCAP